jgi:hypothetical protein
MSIDTSELTATFAKITIPSQIKGCDCPSCISSQSIHRLIETAFDRIDPKDLIDYTSNVLITVGAPEDFRCLLPKILRHWAEDLGRKHDVYAYAHLVHAALNRNQFFMTQLTGEERDVATRFMRGHLLLRLNVEDKLWIEGKKPTHEFFGYVASYGTFTTDIPQLFDEWWQMRTPGHAVAAVLYASCFIAGRLGGKNPLFSAWTPAIGGGPPVLSSFDSSGDNERWCDVNIEYLASTFTLDFLTEKLLHAKVILRCHPQVTKIDELLLMADGKIVREYVDLLVDELMRPT